LLFLLSYAVTATVIACIKIHEASATAVMAAVAAASSKRYHKF